MLRVSGPTQQIRWNKQNVLKLSGYVTTGLLVTCMLFMLYLGISSKINGGVPNLFGREMYIILSGSMEPKLPTGSVIFDNANVNAKTLRKGDIITFHVPSIQDSSRNQNSSMVVTHRIYQITEQNGSIMIKTKGDNNETVDDWIVKPDNLIGKYDGIDIPYSGYILNSLKTKSGIVCTLLIPGVLLLGINLLRLKKEINGGIAREDQI